MIIHLWSKFALRSPDDARRHGLAHSSWAGQPWLDCPVTDSSLPRLFQEGRRVFPYVNDLFDRACENRDSEDIVIYSNADIGFVPDACVRIVFALQANNAGYVFRVDFPRLASPPTAEQMLHGQEYGGTDVFFFRVDWWRACREFMPLLLVAREAWDPVLRIIMEKTNPNKPLSIPRICWHERHGGDGHWESAPNRYTLPGQRYNLALAKTFMKQNNQNPAAFGIR